MIFTHKFSARVTVNKLDVFVVQNFFPLNCEMTKNTSR